MQSLQGVLTQQYVSVSMGGGVIGAMNVEALALDSTDGNSLKYVIN